MSEQTADNETQIMVDRATVEAAIAKWVAGTGAAHLGRQWGVTHKAGLDGLTAWLIAGPVAAVLKDLGCTIVDPSDQ